MLFRVLHHVHRRAEHEGVLISLARGLDCRVVALLAMTLFDICFSLVLQMRRASVRGGARTPMTEPSIWQRSCHLSCESNAFQGNSQFGENKQ